MAERIAHGEILIEVDDQSALARLNAIRSEYHRAMRDIDREEATVEIKGDLADLKDAAANARREVKRLEGERAEISMGIREGDKAKLTKDIAKAKAEVKSLDGMVAEIEIEVHGEDNAKLAQKRIEEATRKRIEAADKLQRQEAALAEKLHKENIRRVNQESRVRESLNKQRLRELTTAEREAYAMDRERDEVPKLELAYARLVDQLQRLGEAKRKARGSDRAVAMVTLEEQSIRADADRIRKEVFNRIGRNPITIPVETSFSERAGARLRREAKQAREVYQAEFNLGKHQGSNMFASAAMLPLATAFGMDIGSRAGKSAHATFRRTFERGLGNSLKDMGKSVGGAGLSAVGDMGSRVLGNLAKLGSASIRLGPFTTSIRGAATAMAVLAPVLVSVIGSLGALVSVAGSAALGVGALGVGLAGGAVPAMLGFGLVIAKVVKEFGAVKKAQKAYDDAVSKHGKTSDQAKKKMEEMRHVMGGVSEETVKQFQGAQKLNSAWNNATRPARASVWKAIGEGLKTGTELMDDFATRTNTGMGIAEKATTKWMRAIRSAAGQQIIGNMMDRFNESLGPALDGMGSLAAYFAKVGEAAAGSLPGLSQTFANWARGLNMSADDATTFRAKIDGVVQSAKDVGRFFLAGGRFLKAFFAGGVASGQRLVNTMTDALNRWTALLEGGGRDDLENFFDRSVSGAQALYSALAPLLASFGEWATLMEPIVTPFIKGAGVVSHFAASLMQITALRGPLTALAATLGVMWSVGKIASAAGAVRDFASALLGLGRAQAGVAATGSVMNATGLLGGAGAARGAGAAARATSTAETAAAAASVAAASRTGRAAQTAARDVGLLRGAVATLIPAVAGSTVALSATTAGIGLLGAAAIYGGYKLATMKTEMEKLDGIFETSTRNGRGAAQTVVEYSQAQQAAAESTKSYERSVGSVADAKRRLAALEREGKRGTDEFAQAQEVVRAKLRERQQAEQDNFIASQRAFKLGAKATTEIRSQTLALNTATAQRKELTSEVAKREKLLAEAQKAGDSQGVMNQTTLLATARQKLAEVTKRQAAAQKALTESMNAQAAAGPAMQRALKGMVDLGPKATQAIGALSRQAGGKGAAIKIATKIEDPKDVGSVARRAQAALKAGVSGSKVKASIDPGNVEATLKRLNTIKLRAQKMKIITEGGDKAIAQIREIAGKKFAAKVQRITTNGDTTVKQKIAALTAMGIPPKVARILAKDGASATINKVDGRKVKPKSALVRAIDRASGVIGRIIGLINSIPSSRTSTITTNHVDHYQTTRSGPKPAAGARLAAGGLAFASGGHASNPDPRQQDRAAVTAGLSGTAKAVSQKVTRPRYLVGEEATPEFVIATNPAYRKRNQQFAAMAARAVGLKLADDAGDQAATKTERSRRAAEERAGVTRAAAGFDPTAAGRPSRPRPPAAVKPRKTDSQKKRTKTRFTNRRQWAAYLEDMQKRRDYLGTEISIREAAVKEPEEWVIVDQKAVPLMGADNKPVLDDKGQPLTYDTYKANPEIVNTYIPGLKYVRQAMEELKGTLSALASAVPQAITSMNMERAQRNEYKAHLRGSAKSGHGFLGLEAKAKAVKTSGLKGAKKEAAEKRKQKFLDDAKELREQYKAQEDVRKSLLTDRAAAEDLGVQTAFDIRESQADLDANQNEIDTVYNKKSSEAAAQTESGKPTPPDSSTGGGGSEGGISMAQQAAILSSEKGNAYKAFAGNVMGNTVALAGAVAGALTGGQKNLAGFAGVTASPVGAAPAVSAVGGASDAVTSSAGAGAAITGSAAGAALAGSSGSSDAFKSAQPSTPTSAPAAPAAAGGGDKSVTVNNTFATVPPDPHTWAKGVEFEVGSIL